LSWAEIAEPRGLRLRRRSSSKVVIMAGSGNTAALRRQNQNPQNNQAQSNACADRLAFLNGAFARVGCSCKIVERSGVFATNQV